MPRILRALGAVALAVSSLAAAVPANAAPQTLDPRCPGLFEVEGAFLVQDTAVAPEGLPPQVTFDDMSCIIDLGPQLAYVYLDDPFLKLTELLTSFAADGWTVYEVLDSGEEIPFALGDLPARESDPEITFRAARGPDGAAIFYSTEPDESEFFADGTFVITNPMLEPGSAGGTALDDPSSLSGLRSIASAAPNAAQAGALALTASLLTLLLGVPAYLLSTVLSARYSQWFGWLERGAIGRWRERVAGTRSRWRRPVLLLGMVLASFLAGFIDPRFGFNLLSVRLFLTLLATFAIFNVGAWLVIRFALRRAEPAVRPELVFHPATLLVVGVAVLLSRLLAFDPGVLFGLVAGVSFGVTLALSREALVVLVGSGYAAAVALLAWVGYSLLGPQGDVLPLALSEFLGALTVEGVSTLPIALIPLATLDGATLFRWRRWAWGAAYAVGVALFMLVLFTIPGDGATFDGGFVRWVIIFGVFAIVAIAVWSTDWLVRRRAAVVEPG